MDPVLLAIRDHHFRATLRFILEEEASYSVAEAHNGITTFAALLASPSPLVVLLDTHLEGHAAAEQLLRVAAAGGPAGRHRYVICTTGAAERLPPPLSERIMILGLPVLQMPFELEEVLRLVARAQGLLPIAVRPAPVAVLA
jgi:DNA-binding NarL/FixJ family response regulator